MLCIAYACVFEGHTNLHILSDKTGLHHPLAAPPIIPVLNVDGALLEDAGMGIFGDLFGIILRDTDDDGLLVFGNQLRVYNWKTGQLLKVPSPLLGFGRTRVGWVR